MRTVLDTNILIAALITKDTPPDILYQAWLHGKIEILTSPAQMSEIAAGIQKTIIIGGQNGSFSACPAFK